MTGAGHGGPADPGYFEEPDNRSAAGIYREYLGSGHEDAPCSPKAFRAT